MGVFHVIHKTNIRIGSYTALTGFVSIPSLPVPEGSSFYYNGNGSGPPGFGILSKSGQRTGESSQDGCCPGPESGRGFGFGQMVIVPPDRHLTFVLVCIINNPQWFHHLKVIL
jgi:hypothetical protein